MIIHFKSLLLYLLILFFCILLEYKIINRFRFKFPIITIYIIGINFFSTFLK
uniref:Uncharacterized protein n=1 Tax=Arcella intermedia TaxID=1963864 RepID=A0A6B2LV52_9EUKA